MATTTSRSEAKPLTGKAKKTFLDFVDETHSQVNLDRILARLRLNRFVILHGEERCQATFDQENKRRLKLKQGKTK